MPSPCNPWARWKRRSAATVAASNRPSTRFAASPYGRRRNSSDATSQPTRPRDSTRCPSSGVPSLPSLQRVAIPSFAVALIRWFRWNVSSAFRVNGPVHSVHCARVEAVRAQRDLERRDPGARGCCGMPGTARPSAAATTITTIRRTELPSFSPLSVPPSGVIGEQDPSHGRLHLAPAAFPGSSIGRASGC